MEHDRRACLRCGQPAEEHRFCQRCRSHIDSLMAVPPRPAPEASDLADPVARASRELVRLEQALAAESNRSSERIGADPPVTAVELDRDSHLAETPTDRASGGAVELTKLPTTAGEATTAPQDVARLEDVLTVSPTRHDARAGAVEETSEANTAPVEEIGSSPTTDEHAIARAKQAVARLEALLSAASADDHEVETHLMPSVQADLQSVDVAGIDTEAAQSADAPEPHTQDTSSASDAGSSTARTLPRHLVTALCLAALIVLAIVRIGRDPRRFRGGRTS